MAKDPYRYFRIEGAELVEGLHRGLLALDKAEGPLDDEVRALLRHAHTLKGAARVVKQVEIGDLAHRIEELFAPCRDSGEKPNPDVIDDALALVDRMSVLLAALPEPEDLDPTPNGAKGASRGAHADLSAVHLSVAEMDGLMETIASARVAAMQATRSVEPLDEALVIAGELADELGPTGGAAAHAAGALLDALLSAQRGLAGASQRTIARIDMLQRSTAELRLVPAEVLMTELERTVRDVCRATGKKGRFTVAGGSTRIDAHVLSRLRKALGHVVRNAVAHGIETPAVRRSRGKPGEGLVEVDIERRGDRIAITCHDDGAGIDAEAVRRVAVERSLVSPVGAEALDVDELIDLLLQGGISTAAEVTEVAGRGIGLDVVRATVRDLRGEVNIHSAAGEGVSVELLVPVSLSALPALAIEDEGIAALVPLDSVKRAIRLRRDEVSRSTDGERVMVDGATVPFMPVRRALGGADGAPNDSPFQIALLLEAGGRRVAVGTDRLLGTERVIVHSLPQHLNADPVVSGAAIDQHEVPRPVLAPAELVRAAFEQGAAAATRVPESRPPLLVIDDSLTSRMLEQSILESAGYEVDVAGSGEEGLGKARQRRYGLFIVDVEMPGMSGFDFLARVQADAKLRDIPAVLVTSRSSAEDKRRGKEVGARAYIVKSEFDQRELLEAVGRLV